MQSPRLLHTLAPLLALSIFGMGCAGTVLKDSPDDHEFETWPGEALLPGLADRVALGPEALATLDAESLYALPACAGETNVGPADFQRVDLDGRNMLYVDVPSPRGILFLLHGAHGHGAVWRGATENLIVVHKAIALGLLPVAITATEDGRVWQTEPDDAQNSDITLAADALTWLYEHGVDEDTPLFALGYSRGGRFATRLTQSFPIQAIATVNSGSGGGFLMGTEGDITPTAFIASRNDHIVMPSTIEDTHLSLLERGVETELYWNEATPLTPGRLSRIDGVSCGDAIDVHLHLVAQGFLDENGYFDRPPQDVNWNALFTGVAAEYASAIRLQFGEVHSNHAFTSDHADALLDFLVRRLES